MRNFYFLFLCTLITTYTFAQYKYNVIAEPSIDSSDLVIDFYIENDTNIPFKLGFSEFAVNLPSQGLDVNATQYGDMTNAEFGLNNADSYGKNLLFKHDKGNLRMAGLFVQVNHKGAGNGVELLQGQRNTIGSIRVPILDTCDYVNLSWSNVKNGIASFSRGSQLNRIENYANRTITTDSISFKRYDDPAPEITPVSDKIFSSYANNNQWYRDGQIISGATQNFIVPDQEGVYTVEHTNACGHAKVSNPVVLKVTGIENFSETFAFEASPNPFQEETTLKFNIPNDEKVKLDIYNILGNKLVTLRDNQLRAGAYSIPLNMDEYGLAAGTYIGKLQVGDKIGTIKLVGVK